MYNSFEVLNKLYFVRTGGSNEELEAAKIIQSECEKRQVHATLEAFDVDGYEIEQASLTFSDPSLQIECAGVGLSSSTSDDGITADVIYVNSLDDAKVLEVKDKICLIHAKLVNYKLYKYLVEQHACGLILCTGDVYKDNTEVDLDPYMYRPRHYENGKIPAVCIRMKDAEKLINCLPQKATIILKQKEMKKPSHNVVATIEGTTFPEEIVAFTAHFDSVSYSKGAYDNATGSTALLEFLSYFVNNKPKRTLKFIWCGSEEMGLLGSKNYVSMHEKELANYKLCINIDMIGVTIGYDHACVTGLSSLVSYLKYVSLEEGFGINVRQGVYSSDSTSFADRGIPAISFARLSPSGGAVIHSRNDVLDHLSEPNYYHTCDFICKFSSRLINAHCFPVETMMPDNMKEELDIYLGRKEKKE